ncbi:hypothetical protein TNCV_4089651 [Trichonephila clavipes]|nr:hypothetical protein TNCV_4089651 [Trichonephila clavipes]
MVVTLLESRWRDWPARSSNLNLREYALDALERILGTCNPLLEPSKACISRASHLLHLKKSSVCFERKMNSRRDGTLFIMAFFTLFLAYSAMRPLPKRPSVSELFLRHLNCIAEYFHDVTTGTPARATPVSLSRFLQWSKFLFHIGSAAPARENCVLCFAERFNRMTTPQPIPQRPAGPYAVRSGT